MALRPCSGDCWGALERYVLPFGGYFFVLPAPPPSGYLGQRTVG